MKLITLFLALMITKISTAQITKTQIASTQNVKSELPYDSLKNFLGTDANKYLNQELYLMEKSESLRKYGYEIFFKITQSEDTGSNLYYDVTSRVYKCCDSNNSKYEDLKGRYYKVIGIEEFPETDDSEIYYGRRYYLELEDKESKERVNYFYGSKLESSFPFLVVGFYEKQKQLWVGKNFVFTDRILRVSSGNGLDILTGKPITIKTGENWKCKDITIEEKYYSLALVVENSLGETTMVSYDATFDKRHFAYTAEEAKRYKTRFGAENFVKILQGLVKIGMTKEMCELSWGTPKDINTTITDGNRNEQWVYENSYLYFDNGILTTIQ